MAGHRYDKDGTSDCAHGCGCWMGPFQSGGPDGIDPFGECPNAPPPPPAPALAPLLALPGKLRERAADDWAGPQAAARIPGAFLLAAKSIGVTTAELDKMLQNRRAHRCGVAGPSSPINDAVYAAYRQAAIDAEAALRAAGLEPEEAGDG